MASPLKSKWDRILLFSASLSGFSSRILPLSRHSCVVALQSAHLAGGLALALGLGLRDGVLAAAQVATGASMILLARVGNVIMRMLR